MRHADVLFVTKNFLLSFGGFTLLTQFSLMTRNYELSLLYVLAGAVLIIWVMYGFVRRGMDLDLNLNSHSNHISIKGGE